MSGDGSVFKYVGHVETVEVEWNDRLSKNTIKVHTVGAGPDAAVTKRRVDLWETDKQGNQESYVQIIQRAQWAPKGSPERILRFSGYSKPAGNGGNYWNGTKAEVYDPAKHGAGPQQGPAGPGQPHQGQVAPGGPVAHSAAPGASQGLQLADAFRAIEILLPFMPKHLWEDGNREARSEWLRERAPDLLRFARQLVRMADTEPQPPRQAPAPTPAPVSNGSGWDAPPSNAWAESHESWGAPEPEPTGANW